MAGKSKGAEVVATLMEESQIEDRFSVILEAGRWVIDDIIANSRSVRRCWRMFNSADVSAPRSPVYPTWLLSSHQRLALVVTWLAVVACGEGPRPAPTSCVGDGLHGFSSYVTFSSQRGIVHVHVKVDVTCILAVDLLVDGQPMGSVRNGGDVTIDSTKLPDGQHVLTLQAPGWADEHADFTTDNTRPVVTSCTPRATAWGELGRRPGIDVTFSERVCWWWDPNICHSYTQIRLGPPLPTPTSMPGHLDLDWSIWTDQALNPFGGPACGADYAAWLSPWGEGPIDVLAGKSRSFGLARLTVDPGEGPHAVVLRLQEGSTGRLQLLSAVPPGDLAPEQDLELDPAAQVMQLQDRSWIELGSDGTTRLRSWTLDGGTVTVTELDPARHPVLQRGWHWTVTWIEDGVGGRRVGREAIDLQRGGGDWWLTPVMYLPERDVLAMYAHFDGYSNSVVITEAVPGAPSQLRVMGLNDAGGWSDAFGSLNLDVAHAATEPTFSLSGGLAVIAWAEDGKVLARMHNLIGTIGLREPLVLNADPAHAARSPRALLPWNRVVFVERWPDGDRFEVRQPHDYLPEWVTYSSLETGGEVTVFETDDDYALTFMWEDSNGDVRLRPFNE